jgi:hypothetical protein
MQLNQAYNTASARMAGAGQRINRAAFPVRFPLPALDCSKGRAGL